MEESAFLRQHASSLAQIKSLSESMQALLLLKRLRRLFRDHKIQPERFYKGNFFSLSAANSDPQGLAMGVPQHEVGQVVRHLLGVPWSRLEQDGYIVSLAGDGWYELTDAGIERSKDEFPAPTAPTVEENALKADKYKGWETIKLLGEGGQSSVYLVRAPKRAEQRRHAFKRVGDLISGINSPHELIENLAECMREDKQTELGALKVFDKARESGAAPADRVRREIAILQAGHPNLPKLLDSDADNLWMVTEYFPSGTLDKSPEHFKGDALRALKAFRPLVATAAYLHHRNIFHRDIKPANIFVGDRGELALGDFGIAFDETSRLTITNERVGPRDYMPQWADLGERLEKIEASFDIYMLGKLLWCMVSGRLKLPREYQNRNEYNLTKLFPDDRRMRAINSILNCCVVEHENECIRSADELLNLVDETLSTLGTSIYLNKDGKLDLACVVCGKGIYNEEATNATLRLGQSDDHSRRPTSIEVRAFQCNFCGHYAFFPKDYPEKALRPKPPQVPPLTQEQRIAYQKLYDQLGAVIHATTDVVALKVLNTQQAQVNDILMKDNIYRLNANSHSFNALLKQIEETNAGLKALQKEIHATTSLYATADKLLKGINGVLSVFISEPDRS